MKNLLISHSYLYATLILILLLFTTLTAQEWSKNGPYSAHVISLAIAPSDTSVIYVGTYCDGIYKSINSAENWIHCSIENLPTWEDSLDNVPITPCWWYGDHYPIQSIAIDPINAEHLWIGTGGRGLFESNNGGISWQQTDETLHDSLDVDYIHINEDNPDELFIGAGNHNYGYLPLENGGLYHAIDGGNNWELIESVPNGDTYHITFITNEPGNEEHLYVGIGSAGEPYFSWGIMESTDGGNEWQILSDEYTFYDLSINPENNLNMWCIIVTGYMDILLASSIDGGYTWIPNYELWQTSLYADIEYNLYVAEGFENTIAGNVKKSSNNGNTWIYIDSLCAGRGVSLHNRCEANRESINNIYFGTSCGIYKSNDGGLNCRLKNSNIFNSYIKEIESHPGNPNIVYAGGYQGLWKSTDGCISWQQENEESISSVKYDPQHPDTLYYGGQNLMRSFDGGNTFEDIRHNVIGIILDIAINLHNTNIIYVTSTDAWGYYVFKTENQGESWNLILGTDGPNYPMITIDPNYPGTLYYANYRSVDGGDTWEHLIFSDEIIGIHPQNSNTIYYSNRNTLKVSYDWGETFQVLDTYTNWAVPVPAIVNLIFDKDNPDNMFYCTPNDGIHYSTDAGVNWFVLEGNYEKRTLDFIPVLEENKVYVATHGDGVWFGENITLNTGNVILPEIRQLSLQNYPNPFNPQTTIKFSIIESGFVELNIYDIKGRLVKKLTNQKMKGGEHYVTWNGNNESSESVSSGVYFYKLNVNGKTETTKKMLLLK